MRDWTETLSRLADLVEQRLGLSRRSQQDRLGDYCAALSMLDQASLADTLSVAPLSDPAWLHLIESLLVHETFFYRHAEQLDVARREALPLLNSRRLAGGRALRVWCAGCSTGEEAYTLAFLLRDAGCPGHVLGTDLSVLSTTEAETGRYYRKPGLNSFRAMPDLAWRHFDPIAGDPTGWSIAEAVRRGVSFAVHNLMTPMMRSGPMDLISCRNTLIYFSDEALRRVEETLVAAAGPGTILLLGPADRLRFTDRFVPLSESHSQILHWPVS
jgi:chemotaxis protein methyltransferase CheR